MNRQVTHGDPPVRRLQHVLTQSVLRHPRGKSAFGAFLGMTLAGFIYPQATMVLKWLRSTVLDFVCLFAMLFSQSGRVISPVKSVLGNG